MTLQDFATYERAFEFAETVGQEVYRNLKANDFSTFIVPEHDADAQWLVHQGWVEASQTDIETLKRQWVADGTWDIEDTPGFEACRGELLEFRRQHEAKMERQARERRKEYQNGIPDHVADEIIRSGRPIEKLALAHAYAVREQTEVQKRIAAALEKLAEPEVKPWEK